MSWILDKNTPWVVSESECEPIERAVRNLANDWYMVFGSSPLTYEKLPEGYEGHAIYIGKTAENVVGKPTERESYYLKSESGSLYLNGADHLGTIYAIYRFSNEILGQDPWYYWNDVMPERKQSVEIDDGLDLSHGSPDFRYRGFFENNEDMISGSFRDPLWENTMDLYQFEKMCELILRLYGNTLAPGTRVYPDETCRELITRCGLYVNDHHVTPLGLNVYMWPKDEAYSYVTNPGRLEEMWEKCVKEESKYRMLWTVSFRGKGDGAFWNVDPAAPKDDAGRADVINRAVAKQVEMIRKVQPDADIIFNMYNEQANLCAKGLLKIPDGVIKVWPNDGAGIMADKGSAEKGDGAYYHITACRNRFTEAVSPETIYSELGRFKKIGANGCLIMNVGNIRHFPMSIGCVMDLVYDGKKYADLDPKDGMKKYIGDYCERYFGTASDKVSDIAMRFFGCSNFRRPVKGKAPFGYAGQCLGMYASDWRADYNQVLTDFRQSIYMHEIARALIKAIKGEKELGDIFVKTVDDFNSMVREETAYLPELSREAHLLEKEIPDRAKALYSANLLTQIDGVNKLNLAMEKEGESLKSFIAGDWAAAERQMREALWEMEDMIEVLHRAETPKWPVWYNYESLDCFWHTRDLLACALSLLEGKGETLVRPFTDFGGHGRAVNFYHYKRGIANYPFLKKHTED